jgi:hypothetical protein
MAVYWVLQPTAGSKADGDSPDRFVFLQDGFNWAAFLFGPLWMIRRGLWLGLLGYVVILVALEAAIRLVGAPSGARIAVAVLFALLIGLEGASLRRWTLVRRGWRDLGVVVADDREAAEWRFFSAWTERNAAAPVSANLVQPAPDSGAGTPLGMFPQPGAGR